MTLKLELQIKRDQLAARNHAALMREINRRVMERQRDERVPKHFEVGAYSTYHAKQRGAKYNAWKMRKKYVGHIKPNVLTGTLKRSMRFKVTATQNGSRLIMSARLGKRVDPEEWAKLSPKQQAAAKRKQRRLAKWQKEEIARLSGAEIKEERKRQAAEYRRGATGKYKRIRSVRKK